MVFKQHERAGVVEIESSAFGAEVAEPTTGSGSLGAIVGVPARTRGARSGQRYDCGLKQKLSWTYMTETNAYLMITSS